MQLVKPIEDEYEYEDDIPPGCILPPPYRHG
jgi:hypothetical protein